MPGKYTNHDDIVRVIELHKSGKTNREIGRITNVNEKTVSVLVRKWREEGCEAVPYHKHGGGPAQKVSNNTLRIIKRELYINPQLTAKQLKEKNLHLLQNVSVRTIQRVIRHRLHYRKVKARTKPHVNETQRKRRRDFAKKHKDWDLVDWRKVLWTDEATFSISDTRGTKVWRPPGTSACDPHYTVTRVKHPPYLMVWGAFGYGGLADLVFLPKGQTVDSKVYLNILNDNLADCFATTGAEILQQDNAPCHTAKIVKDWLHNSEVDFIPDWPAQSPDISPIENLWGIVKARLREEDTSTIPKLEEALRKVWSKIPHSTAENLADSVPGRLKMVLKMNGYPINK